MLIRAFLQIRERRFKLQLRIEQEKSEAERLKDLDKFKSNLYTNITHEFRTPLTVIAGITDKMDADPKSKSIVKRNTDQLLNLVNQMLDLRKLESGEIKIVKRQGDIIKLLRYLTESIQSLAELKGLNIHFLPKENEIIMDFDEEKITRIHTNLLSNAIKFTDKKGNIYVQIARVTSDSGDLLEWSVRDTGIGIPAAKLSNIFERFYQVDHGSTRKGEGTGIGLTLAAEFVRNMDGEISAKSKLDVGTTFIVRLPIYNEAAWIEDASTLLDTHIPTLGAIHVGEQNQFTQASSSIHQEEQPLLQIVEDNADVIHYLIQCLKSDYKIEIALNGEEGIEKAIEHVPDIILSDVMMPIKDGLELCQTLKTDLRTSHIPIILLTAKADLASRLDGISRGADAYLSKPFHEQELLLILSTQLELRKKLRKRFAITNQENEGAILHEELPTIEIDIATEDAFLQQIRDILEKDLSDTSLSMPFLEKKLGMSRSHIYRKVKSLTGMTPSNYMNSIRLMHAKNMLADSDMNVSEVAYAVGYSSPSYFSKMFAKEYGQPPKAVNK